MEILFVISSLAGGGAERVASELVNGWAKQGRGVGLLTLTNSVADHYTLEPRVVRHRLELLWRSENIFQSANAAAKRLALLRRTILAIRPKVVISFIELTNIAVLGATIGTQIPVIVSERIDPRYYKIGWVREALRRVAYPFASRLVVQTDAVAQWAQRVLGWPEVVFISNPLRELPTLAPYDARARQVVAVGRLARQKGFDLLIEAFGRSGLKNEGWRLVILGDGPERAKLEAMIAHLGLDEAVRLPGMVADPAPHLNRARIFVLPSRFEGFPNALLEAMGMGCAVIAADCPSGPREIIHHGVDGLLVPPGNIEALAQAMRDLAVDPQRAARLGQAALEVRERYARERILAQWDELIDEVLAEDKQCRCRWIKGERGAST